MSEGGAVEKAGRRRVIGGRITTFTNTFFFLFAGLASLWLVLLAYLDTRASRWVVVLFVVALWAVMAYVFLPRLYKLMTTIFLPDYFIGRARTSTGILGDVINMAWDGSDANIHRTMQAAGWTLATPITLKSSIKIVVSVVTHTSYSAAPVSPLFLFGRQQDFAYQKEVDGSAGQRHHIRFWKCPSNWPLPGGARVDWLAAAAFDKGVRLSGYTLQVTHEISGNIDKERDYTITTVEKVDPDLKVEWIHNFSTAFHARNGGGDMVHTDGNLPIVDVRTLPDSIPPLSPAQLDKIAKGDPPPGKAFTEELRRVPRPPHLYGMLILVVAAIVDLFYRLFLYAYFPAQVVWGIAILYAVLAGLVFYGYSAARWLLMMMVGLTVVEFFIRWIHGGFVVTSETGIFHIGVAVLLLLVLSSNSVTNFTADISRWRRERGEAKKAS